ncbi:MAG: hypothetical protein RL432_2053 [Bacteroidota bacterium]
MHWAFIITFKWYGADVEKRANRSKNQESFNKGHALGRALHGTMGELTSTPILA